MKISLTQSEIEGAIIDHLKTVINLPEGMEFRVEMAATRGSAGFTADVAIVKGEALETPSRVTERVSEPEPASDGESQVIEEPAIATPKRVSLFAGIKQA